MEWGKEWIGRKVKILFVTSLSTFICLNREEGINYIEGGTSRILDLKFIRVCRV